MRYVLAFLFPPLAVLLCGKPFQALLNILLCFLWYIPGVLHALVVVSTHLADVRSAREIKAGDAQTEHMLNAMLAMKERELGRKLY